MNAFIPTTGLSAVSGRSVLARQNGDAMCTLRNPRTARMSVSYPYTGSGYGAAGIPYGGSSTGVGYAATSAASIVETAASVPIFGTLVNLLVETGLDYELSKGGPYTVFAPTDEAFASLLNPHGFATLGALLRPENRAYLKDVLSYHVALGDISASSIIADGKVVADTMNGAQITLMGYNKRVSAGSAAVIKGDVVCSNGTIHVVNSILTPPNFVTPPIRADEPEFADSLVLDVLKNRIEPRQALGIDPRPAAEESSALTL